MLLPRKWALGLGLLAAAPSLAVAGPLDFLKSNSGRSEAAQPHRTNQEVAADIGRALQKAPLVHKDVSIEYANGVATIKGQIKDAGQRSLVSRLARNVAGVDTVDNQLELMHPGDALPIRPGDASPVNTRAVAAAPQRAPVQAPSQVSRAQSQTAAPPVQRVERVEYQPEPRVTAAAPSLPVSAAQRSASSNQEVAQQIAEALTSAGLSGYDIEVRYKGGIASLMGNVEDKEQAARAQQAASGVPGVNQVINQLGVSRRAADLQSAPAYAQQQYPGMAPGMAPRPQGVPPGYQGYPQGMPGAPQGYPQGMPGGPQGYPVQQVSAQAAGPMGPPPYGHVQPASHQMYNQPNVPDYAWPSYATYDNSAAVTYPSMYDASAWPYIGPYYPYPQVPLGWRSSTLEWDDGYWSLKFNSRTDHWWWFLNPHNWHSTN